MGYEISGIFLDTRIVGDTRIVIEFPTIPGKTYTIIYSDNNLFTWQVATPSITANADNTQWYDDGPPKTDSKPYSITSRFYRVIAAPSIMNTVLPYHLPSSRWHCWSRRPFRQSSRIRTG